MEKKLIRDVRKLSGNTIFKYSMIDPDDRILAGLSGGKDSLSMLDVLSDKIRRISVKFSLTAAYIELSGVPSQVKPDALEKLCSQRNIPFIHHVVEIDLSRDPSKSRCYICALHRRNSLFSLAKKLNFNKLALGHNLDDIISTLLMNMSYHGNISTMPPEISLFGGYLKIIRPLAEIDEDDIIKYSKYLNFDIQINPCPFDEGKNRHLVKKLINELAADNKHIKTNIFRSMGRIRSDYLS